MGIAWPVADLDVDILAVRSGLLLEFRVNLHSPRDTGLFARTSWRLGAGQTRHTRRFNRRRRQAQAAGGVAVHNQAGFADLLSCRSVFTSRSSGRPRSFCSTSGA